jgi:hypothetical protein
MQSVPNEQVVGKLTMFDRMIFHGHLSSLYPQGAFKRFLDGQGVLLKEFGPYVERATAAVKAHAARVAAEAGRPFTYLQSATTKASGQSKEDLARAIAARDGITQGLVCVFSVLENCFSFEVRGKEPQNIKCSAEPGDPCAQGRVAAIRYGTCGVMRRIRGGRAAGCGSSSLGGSRPARSGRVGVPRL